MDPERAGTQSWIERLEKVAAELEPVVEEATINLPVDRIDLVT
jgi:hypothetical protein